MMASSGMKRPGRARTYGPRAGSAGARTSWSCWRSGMLADVQTLAQIEHAAGRKRRPAAGAVPVGRVTGITATRVLATAVPAAWLSARRAARVDPAVTLRAE